MADNIAPLPFGVPALDRLLGYADLDAEDLIQCLDVTTSLTIVGQDGTGKSVFALHLAAAYQAMRHHKNQTLAGRKSRRDRNQERHPEPLVLYVSSDLKYTGAKRVWHSFYLDVPWLRYVPFITGKETDFRRDIADRKHDNLKLTLELCAPERIATTAHEWMHPARRSAQGNASVHFVDLAERTTGDDWLFITRLVASIGRLSTATPPNLLVIDSIAGFETLVGKRNSFGESMSRRARIAQLIRAAGNNWHTVFVVEEPEPGLHHPEEYVTDTVLHLRRESENEKVRRILEIEKSRSRSFASGVHPFEIRDGIGSSTGSWENPDDPRTFRRPEALRAIKEIESRESGRSDFNCYIQVFPSLNYLSKDLAAKTVLIVGRRLTGNTGQKPNNVPFGIPYLDNMLAAPDAFSIRGLPEGSVTSLIGDEGTLKTSLAEQFFVENFAYFPQLLDLIKSAVKSYFSHSTVASTVDINRVLKRIPEDVAEFKGLSEHVQKRIGTVLSKWLENYPTRKKFLEDIFKTKPNIRLRNEQELLSAVQSNDPFGMQRPLAPRWDHKLYYCDITRPSPDAENALTLAILRMSSGLVAPCVYISTHDTSSEKIASQILDRHDGEIAKVFGDQVLSNIHRDALSRLLERFIIVRRLDLTDATGPQLWHVIQGCVNEALLLLGDKPLSFDAAPEMQRTSAPGKSRGSVRVVVNDLRLIRDTYPSVNADPLFLPTAVFRLRRLGVTVLMVDSENGRPDSTPASSMNGALRSLVDHQIYTWKVPFFGEERVAISVIPPFPGNAAGIIRELRFEDDVDKSRILVDPRFSLYSGVEEGRPSAVPLEIVLYAETSAFDEYVGLEQGLFSQMFSTARPDGRILRVEGTRDYERLRDYCHLSTDTRLPLTLIFVVDEFWAISRGDSLRGESAYLYSPLKDQPEKKIREIDSFGLFTPTRRGRDSIANRAESFKQVQSNIADTSWRYDSLLPAAATGHSSKAKIDRIPFMWDFGFLILNQSQWENAAEVALSESQERIKICDVRSKLEERRPLSWRTFFEACSIVAQIESRRLESHTIAFDLATATPESLSCCLLEIWLSEIAFDAERLASSGQEEAIRWSDRAFRDLNRISNGDRWSVPSEPLYLQDLINETRTSSTSASPSSSTLKDFYTAAQKKRLRAGSGSPAFVKIIRTFPRYSLQLYKTWLLLLEVLDFNKYQDPDHDFELKVDYQATASAAASRHWYKTACAATANLDSFRTNEGILSGKLLTRLPGQFSVRGDWFLGVAKGSRSYSLADRALDLLTSRRANRTRLHLGLGLPVRDILPGQNIRRIRTRLSELTPELNLRHLEYGEVLSLGPKYLVDMADQSKSELPEFGWIFRSAFGQFDRQSRVVQKWIHRMLTWTVQNKNRHKWRYSSGFDAYDAINSGKLDSVSLPSFVEFAEGLDIFIDELNAATLADPIRSGLRLLDL